MRKTRPLSFAEAVIFSVLTNSAKAFRVRLTDGRYDGHSLHQPVEPLLRNVHGLLFGRLPKVAQSAIPEENPQIACRPGKRLVPDFCEIVEILNFLWMNRGNPP